MVAGHYSLASPRRRKELASGLFRSVLWPGNHIADAAG